MQYQSTRIIPILMSSYLNRLHKNLLMTNRFFAIRAIVLHSIRIDTYYLLCERESIPSSQSVLFSSFWINTFDSIDFMLCTHQNAKNRFHYLFVCVVGPLFSELDTISGKKILLNWTHLISSRTIKCTQVAGAVTAAA